MWSRRHSTQMDDHPISPLSSYFNLQSSTLKKRPSTSINPKPIPPSSFLPFDFPSEIADAFDLRSPPATTSPKMKPRSQTRQTDIRYIDTIETLSPGYKVDESFSPFGDRSGGMTFGRSAGFGFRSKSKKEKDKRDKRGTMVLPILHPPPSSVLYPASSTARRQPGASPADSIDSLSSAFSGTTRASISAAVVTSNTLIAKTNVITRAKPPRTSSGRSLDVQHSTSSRPQLQRNLSSFSSISPDDLDPSPSSQPRIYTYATAPSHNTIPPPSKNRSVHAIHSTSSDDLAIAALERLSHHLLSEGRASGSQKHRSGEGGYDRTRATPKPKSSHSSHPPPFGSSSAIYSSKTRDEQGYIKTSDREQAPKSASLGSGRERDKESNASSSLRAWRKLRPPSSGGGKRGAEKEMQQAIPPPIPASNSRLTTEENGKGKIIGRSITRMRSISSSRFISDSNFNMGSHIHTNGHTSYPESEVILIDSKYDPSPSYPSNNSHLVRRISPDSQSPSSPYIQDDITSIGNTPFSTKTQNRPTVDHLISEKSYTTLGLEDEILDGVYVPLVLSPIRDKEERMVRAQVPRGALRDSMHSRTGTEVTLMSPSKIPIQLTALPPLPQSSSTRKAYSAPSIISIPTSSSPMIPQSPPSRFSRLRTKLTPTPLHTSLPLSNHSPSISKSYTYSSNPTQHSSADSILQQDEESSNGHGSADQIVEEGMRYLEEVRKRERLIPRDEPRLLRSGTGVKGGRVGREGGSSRIEEEGMTALSFLIMQDQEKDGDVPARVGLGLDISENTRSTFEDETSSVIHPSSHIPTTQKHVRQDSDGSMAVLHIIPPEERNRIGPTITGPGSSYGTSSGGPSQGRRRRSNGSRQIGSISSLEGSIDISSRSTPTGIRRIHRKCSLRAPVEINEDIDKIENTSNLSITPTYISPRRDLYSYRRSSSQSPSSKYDSITPTPYSQPTSGLVPNNVRLDLRVIPYSSYGIGGGTSSWSGDIIGNGPPTALSPPPRSRKVVNSNKEPISNIPREGSEGEIGYRSFSLGRKGRNGISSGEGLIHGSNNDDDFKGLSRDNTPTPKGDGSDNDHLINTQTHLEEDGVEPLFSPIKYRSKSKHRHTNSESDDGERGDKTISEGSTTVFLGEFGVGEGDDVMMVSRSYHDEGSEVEVGMTDLDVEREKERVKDEDSRVRLEGELAHLRYFRRA